MLVTSDHLHASLRSPPVHGFSCRTGGVSQGRHGSLNLSDKWGDDPENVRENLRRFAAAVGFEPARLVTARQVHGVEVVAAKTVTEETEADAVWTRRGSGVIVGVRTADCVPVLLVDGEAGLCAAVHSGWRGTAANISGAAVTTLRREGARPGGLRAAIGPCIEVEAFEVGEEVAEAFAPAFVRRDLGPKPHVDLRACVRAQLRYAGLRDEDVVDVGGCTHAQPARHFSYRRDGSGIGQQLSVIGWG